MRHTSSFQFAGWDHSTLGHSYWRADRPRDNERATHRIPGRIATSPDGVHFASATKMSMRLWGSLAATSLGASIDDTGPAVICAAISPDGSSIARVSMFNDGGFFTLTICDTSTWEDRSLPCERLGWVSRISFSPSSSHILVPGESAVQILDAVTGTLVIALHTSTSGVQEVLCSLHESRVVWSEMVSGETTLHLWDGATRTPITAMKHMPGPITFSPNYSYLACFSENQATIWDSATCTLIL
jgi:hypothetical protein